MSRAIISAFVFVLCSSLAPFAAPAAAQANHISLTEAQSDLEFLKRLVHRRDASNAEIVEYVRVVAKAYEDVDGAADDVARFRRDAEKVLLKALASTRVRDDVNTRAAVNIAAAKSLGALSAHLDEKARGRLAKRLRKFVKVLHKARYDVDDDLTHAVFDAIGHVGTAASLEWIIDEYTHTRAKESVSLVAAHRALRLFGEAPGKTRHEIVKTFIKTYAGVESEAERSANDPVAVAKKRLWDRIRIDVIGVLQQFADYPRNSRNQVLAKVDEFQAWFRQHKNPRKAPWTD